MVSTAPTYIFACFGFFEVHFSFSYVYTFKNIICLHSKRFHDSFFISDIGVSNSTFYATSDTTIHDSLTHHTTNELLNVVSKYNFEKGVLLSN